MIEDWQKAYWWLKSIEENKEHANDYIRKIVISLRESDQGLPQTQVVEVVQGSPEHANRFINMRWAKHAGHFDNSWDWVQLAIGDLPRNTWG